MNQHDIAKNKMYKATLSFLNTNIAIFNTFGRLNTEIKNYSNLNTTLDVSIAAQGKTTTGITSGKADIFSMLIADTVKAARKAIVFAKDQKDEALQAVFNVTHSFFKKVSETVALTRVKEIYDALNNNAAALAADYMVSAADINSISAGIDSFTQEQPAPTNAASAKKAARQNIAVVMKQIDDSLAIIDDLIEHTYEDDNAELVDEYFSNRLIDNIGVRHSGIRATITDAATHAPLEGAVMHIESLSKAAVANIEGLAEIISVSSGTFHVSFSAAGYIAQTLMLTIEKGVIGTIDIELSATTNGQQQQTGEQK